MLSNHLQCLLKATDSIADSHDSIFYSARGSCVHDLFNASIVQEIFSFNSFNVFNYLIYLFFMRCFARVAVLRRAVHGWAIILLTVTQHVAARTKQGRANVTHTSHNKRLSYWMLFSAPFDKLGVVTAAALLQDRAEVRCSQLAVMWSLFMSGCSDRWSLSVVLKAVHTVTSQSSGAAHIQQRSALITPINTLNTTAVFSKTNHKQINYF